MNTKQLLDRLNVTEMDLHCQAQMDIHSGAVGGMELLLRAKRDGQYIPPPLVIDEARRSGYGQALALWSIERAIAIRNTLEKAGTTRIVRVNLMESEVATADFPAAACSLIADDPVEIELVEVSRLDDFAPVANGLRKFMEHGIKTWLDDFSRTPSDAARISAEGAWSGIKIDRHILVETPRSGIAGLIELTEGFSALGLDTIIEGVETLQDMVRAAGTRASMAQGYYLHRPESCEDSIETFKQREKPFSDS